MVPADYAAAGACRQYLRRTQLFVDKLFIGGRMERERSGAPPGKTAGKWLFANLPRLTIVVSP